MAASFAGLNAHGQLVGSNTNVLTLTTTRTINPGERVICACPYIWATHDVIQTITVGSLALYRDVANHNNPMGSEIWSAIATQTIASGATVTITWLNSSTGYMAGICASLGGVAFGRDVSTTNVGSGGPLSTGSVSDRTADAISVTCVAQAASGALTVDASFTVIDQEVDNTQGNNGESDYKLLTAPGAQAASWTTLGGNVAWSAVLAVYSALAPSVFGTPILNPASVSPQLRAG